MSTLSFLLSILLIVLLSIYFKTKIFYRTFWKNNGVLSIETIFPFGNALDTLSPKIHFSCIMKRLYDKYHDITDLLGLYFFTKPNLLVMTPEMAKTILVTDFQYFYDRGLYHNEKTDPLSANLFWLEGEKWKSLRQKLTPTFTSMNLKHMFHVINSISERLVEHIDGESEVEVREMLACLTTDIIGTCAFGVECNSIKNPDSEFRRIGKIMFSFSKIQGLKMFFTFLFKKQATALGLNILDPVVTKYFISILKETIDVRKKFGSSKKDFLDLLLQLHYDGKLKDGKEVGKLTFNEIAAQCYIFFFAGFETSSSTMSYALYELAQNPIVQGKLRDEVSAAYDRDGEFTYESVQSMEYLDRVISETLRKHPPIATIHRISTQDYQFPNGVKIPKDVQLVIPTLGFHHDAKYFPEPEKFDPDRFSDEEKSKRHPFAYLPFGEGPRICIGLRFGVLQSKVGLAHLIRNYRFEFCDRTVNPLVIDPLGMLYVPKDGVWLKIHRTA